MAGNERALDVLGIPAHHPRAGPLQTTCIIFVILQFEQDEVTGAAEVQREYPLYLEVGQPNVTLACIKIELPPISTPQ